MCVCVCVDFMCVCVLILCVFSLLYYSYVAWVRTQKVGATASRMGTLKQYVLARDAEPTAAPEPGHVLPRPGNCTVYKTAWEVL